MFHGLFRSDKLVAPYLFWWISNQSGQGTKQTMKTKFPFFP